MHTAAARLRITAYELSWLLWQNSCFTRCNHLCHDLCRDCQATPEARAPEPACVMQSLAVRGVLSMQYDC
jgi:hypothetical protein